MPKFQDRTGQRFGKLVAVEILKKNGYYHYKCKCDCGNEVTVSGGNLTRSLKPTRSCGCLKEYPTGADNPNYRHGHAVNGKRSKLNSKWTSMMQRCYNPNDGRYIHYGGRGISVCDRWHTFQNFADDMGEPGKRMTLERIEVNGNYEPSNCRWATQLEQTRNARSNIVVTYNGKKMCLSEACELSGVNRATATSRLERGVPMHLVFHNGNVRKLTREFNEHQ